MLRFIFDDRIVFRVTQLSTARLSRSSFPNTIPFFVLFFSEYLRFPFRGDFFDDEVRRVLREGRLVSRTMFLTCLVLLYLRRFRLIDLYLSVGRYRRQGEPNFRQPRPWQGGLRRQNDNNQRTAGEFSVSFLLQGRLLYGYTIRELNHSHPFSNKASS